MTSGTTLSGTWRGTTTIPQYSEAGTWRIAAVQVIDSARNQRSYTTAQLQALGFATDFTVVSLPSDIARPTVTGLNFSPAVIDTSAAIQNVTVTLALSDDLAGVSFAPDTPSYTSGSGLQFVSPSGGQVSAVVNASFKRIAGTALNGLWTATVRFPKFSEGGTWKIRLYNIKDAANNRAFYSTADVAAMGLPTDLTIFRPSGEVDATIPPNGGTAIDDFFGSRASVTFPSGSLPGSTDVAIDVLPDGNALGLPSPAGFTSGTLFVNVALTPMPPMPFLAPGLSVVLPFSAFRTPGSAISLYRLDPLLGTLVPAISVSGSIVVGTVNSDGLSATFTGVSHLSTLVGFVPVSVLGDVDGDGFVSCLDLVIVKNAFGRRPGQTAFDIRADLNRNGVVDVSDLALVSRQLPAGTVCP